MATKQDALNYHSQGRKGKIEVLPTKPLFTQRDLSLAYTPGVAEPCLAIAKNPAAAFEYTSKGNLVAVVSNGTAVLGLGNIGPLAGKPVMEGKANLFKRFADIDVFDIEIDADGVEEVVAAVRAIAPTFGGINLEDIKAPDCFEIERRLEEELDIPVFHDDQHGTAIIAGAALSNACELTNRELNQIKIVFTGAGAAAIATAKMLVALGVNVDNIWMYDVHGLVYTGRAVDMFPEKDVFAQPDSYKDIKLSEALVGADVFIGLSVGGLLTGEMLKSMASKPIVFAMANPVPEITYDEAKSAVPDAIIATGRSDYPNQVNNVLGFPFVFRGALDCRARCFSQEMKVAAVRALAELAKQEVPEQVLLAYNSSQMKFGPDYLIPKPFDPRVLLWVAPAVVEAAIASGQARNIIDLDEYKNRLSVLLERTKEMFLPLISRARRSPKRIVFSDGSHEKILRAAHQLVEENVCQPILIGNEQTISQKAQELGIPLDGIDIVDHDRSELSSHFSNQLWELRQRKGMTQVGSKRAIRDQTNFGCMMVRNGMADGLLGGIATPYSETLKPALEILGRDSTVQTISGVYALLLGGRRYFFGDCTVNITPTAEQLAQIAINTANVARTFGEKPTIAMLSYSDFGTHRDDPQTQTIRKAIKIVKSIDPSLNIDGEMQADTAVNSIIAKDFSFSNVAGKANVLIFPNLLSGNISYKLLSELGNATAIGPIIVGMAQPVNALSMGAKVSEIFNMAVITANQAIDIQYKNMSSK